MNDTSEKRAVDEKTTLLVNQSEDDTFSSPERRNRLKSVLGLSLMALSSVGFASMSLIVALLGKSLPSLEIVFARSVTQTVLSGGWLLLKGESLFGPKNTRVLLILRGLAGASGMACFFYGMTHMPLGDATVVFFTNPIFTAILASIVLKEKWTHFDSFASLLSFAGIVLIARPPALFGTASADHAHTHAAHLTALLVTLAGAVLAASAYTLVRAIGQKTSFLHSVFYFGIVSTLLSPPAAYLLQTPKMPTGSWQWVGVGGVGLAAFFGQCLLNKGLQLEKAGPATLMRNLDIAFALVFQVSILHQKLFATSVIGACLILLCSVILLWKKLHAAKTES